MEAGDEHRHKIVHLFAAPGGQRFLQTTFRQQELVVPGRELFQTLQIGAQGVGLLHNRFFFFAALMFVDKRRKNIAQFVRYHFNELLLGDFFYRLVLLGNLRVEILDRGRQIAGQHFGGVVIHRQQRNTFGIDLSVKLAVFNGGERVSDHRDLKAVFRDVLRAHVAHQRPAVN